MQSSFFAFSYIKNPKDLWLLEQAVREVYQRLRLDELDKYQILNFYSDLIPIVKHFAKLVSQNQEGRFTNQTLTVMRLIHILIVSNLQRICSDLFDV